MARTSTTRPHSGPPIDTTVPHSARIWNYWLGGKDNYRVDRQAGDAYAAEYPGIVGIARHSRAFLTRTVRHLARDAGIRQFLDVGTGLPAARNTHEIAQSIAPESHIAYVDNDPVVLLHARVLLTSDPRGATHYIGADLHDPGTILRHAAAALDLTRPVALILSGVTGHIADHDRARAVVAHLMDGLPPGSHLSLNDGVHDLATTGGQAPPEAYRRAQKIYNASGAVPYILRSLAQITAYFDGLDLLAPGIVSVPHWHPDDPTADLPVIGQAGGVGRKP
ncbi:SAM-dependent methyltransferase [Sinosporangium siamense]|uniref:S-adenosyl methyltransferase n=1 Tax=Sinosporangium siamense TaxID=1367973 RepID=A0A919RLA3_9ACTN|nr:SAM-dependent methyltransferase [Sinosporangium siamense]GII94029.1 hypothetical protein Ssi02_42600 [Sinosporangium siamense]